MPKGLYQMIRDTTHKEAEPGNIGAEALINLYVELLRALAKKNILTGEEIVELFTKAAEGATDDAAAWLQSIYDEYSDVDEVEGEVRDGNTST